MNTSRRTVLAHLKEARAELLAVLDGLNEREMTTQPVASAWTIRDILAHVSGWAAWDLTGMRSIRAGRHPDWTAIQDVDAFNARLVDERRDWTLEQILGEMVAVEAALRELLANLSEEDLFNSGPFRGPYWDTLAGWLQIAGEHEVEHAAQIRVWRAGREERK